MLQSPCINGGQEAQMNQYFLEMLEMNANSYFVVGWSFSEERLEADAAPFPVVLSTVLTSISQSAALASRAPFAASSTLRYSSLWHSVETTRASVAGFSIRATAGAARELVLAESAFRSLNLITVFISLCHCISYHVDAALSADDVFTLMRTRWGVWIPSDLHLACLTRVVSLFALRATRYQLITCLAPTTELCIHEPWLRCLAACASLRRRILVPAFVFFAFASIFWICYRCIYCCYQGRNPGITLFAYISRTSRTST